MAAKGKSKKAMNFRKRELIDTGGDKRYVRRDASGQFSEVSGIGRSLSQDVKSRGKAKYIRNNGKPWTKAQVSQLDALAKKNTPTRVIGLKLGRTEDAVRSKASSSGVALKPTNQAPYDRRGK